MTDAASDPAAASIAVLICDDFAGIRTALRAVLDLRPSLHVVGEAGDGNEAIAQATRLQPDVILLDLAMPHRSGLQALGELRRVAPTAKIIAFSAFSASNLREQVLNLGAVLYLEEGADPDTINDAIEQAATLSLPLTPTPAERNGDQPQPTRSEPSFATAGDHPLDAGQPRT